MNSPHTSPTRPNLTETQAPAQHAPPAAPRALQPNEAPHIDAKALHNPRWSAQERRNVDVVLDFFQTLMNAHDFERTLKQHQVATYVQHNRAIPTGIAGLVAYVKGMVKRFPEYAFDVKRVVASGDFVVLHSHTTLKAKHRGNENKGFIITDTFRLEDGALAEHWDAIQPIDFGTRLLFLMVGGKVANTHPTF